MCKYDKNKEYFEIVSTVCDDQFKYINDFISALQKVSGIYYTYTYKNNKNKYPERVFAYELYHQFRKIMESKSTEYSGVYLNGEQTKSKEVVDELERQCSLNDFNSIISRSDYFTRNSIFCF